MKKSIYKSSLKNSISEMVNMKVLAFTMVLSNLILALFVITADTSEKTIVTPPNFTKPFWVKGSEVSPDYVEQMTRFFLNYMKTYQTANARYQFEEVQRFAHPSIYQSFKAVNDAEADRIERNSLGSVFYFNEIDIKKNRAFITGELVGSIGQQWLPRKLKFYEVTYQYISGNFYITAFNELTRDPSGNYAEVNQEEDEMIEQESLADEIIISDKDKVKP
ncbi:MAG: TraE/TraK family type IV conjugative transfer system protein [Methylococcales bacterium]